MSMSLTRLKEEIEQSGRRLGHWRAQLEVTAWGAAVLLAVTLFGLSDLLARFSRSGRIAVWLVLVALLVTAVIRVVGILARTPTRQAVAARIEKAFPELDNHLINCLQFAEDRHPDPFKAAYLSAGVPAWPQVDLTRMKNRTLHRRALLGLACAAVLLLLPATLSGRAWVAAVMRVVNPFADIQPVSLTRIVDVKPGNAALPQGKPVTITCVVSGVKGHRVRLDVRPADGTKSTTALGALTGQRRDTFAYRLPKLTTAVDYRVRAGDAPFPEWYRLEPRPPLALTALELEITPPPYTGLEPRVQSGLHDDLTIPAGSTVRFRLSANAPLDTARIAVGSDKTAGELQSGGKDQPWTGELEVRSGDRLALTLAAANGESLATTVHYRLIPDQPPVIRVQAPRGRAELPPGTSPRIEFAVSDDYGLVQVALERLVPGRGKAAGDPVRVWKAAGAQEITEAWQDGVPAAGAGTPLAFRLVARDTCGFDPNVSRSAPIVFHTPTAEALARRREELERDALTTLGRVITLQRGNIDATRRYEAILPSTTADHWGETAETQQSVRTLTRDLLSNPAKPLGALTERVKKLYVEEMAEAVTVLRRVWNEPEPGRPALVRRALSLENKILRQLSAAQVAAAETRVQRRVSDLTAMLAALIKGQTDVLKTTARHANMQAPVGTTLVDRQDGLALDLTEFAGACRREADTLAGNDREYSEVLQGLAESCDQQKIRADMLLAAEALDQDKPGEAMPHEQKALDKLEALQSRFAAVQTAEEKEENAAMLDAVREARAKLEKIRNLHEQAVQTMDMVKDQKDRDTREFDLMEEEYQELVQNTKEALLEIPRDLQVFMELNVANDLVEDVFSIFEEVEQEEGTEELTPDDVKELAVAKREDMLEMMEEAEGRLDDIESYLDPRPDDLKVTTEPFDQEEMPEGGIALGALSTEAEDLIGDLLERQEDMAEEADDGAINTALPDMPSNGAVKEGDITSFAAKGKSGNETPDHKEQDGRSNVGRQGMSVGETAAGSGMINEGDKDIEARRTQDPTQSGQVDLDGEADTRATGGGKQASGKADAYGMSGGARRMDSTEVGSMAGMEALMAKRADNLFAKASMKNVRADSLKEAAHHLRQAADAIARGASIQQVRELRARALAALKRARTELGSGRSTALDEGLQALALDDVFEGAPEEAPAAYRQLVAEYYKALSESL